MDVAYKFDNNNYAEYGNIIIRSQFIEIWNDFYMYAVNLNGNWQASQDIYYKIILPTACSNPKLFAKWTHNLVKTSGVKIRKKSVFINSIKKLMNTTPNKAGINKIMTEMFIAGLDKPIYAKNALNNIGSSLSGSDANY